MADEGQANPERIDYLQKKDPREELGHYAGAINR
jgi:hypothetical protein